MDRKNRRVTYLTGANATFNAYGMNDDQKKKKNKKKNAIQSRIRMAILIFALIGVLIVCVVYALTGSTREGVGRVTRIGATLSQNVSPFGDSVIFYDGTTLHCVAATGGNEWSYQIGTNADYDATEKRMVGQRPVHPQQQGPPHLQQQDERHRSVRQRGRRVCGGVRRRGG